MRGTRLPRAGWLDRGERVVLRPVSLHDAVGLLQPHLRLALRLEELALQLSLGPETVLELRLGGPEAFLGLR